MKFTISYKFKLKMVQNLSGRSRQVQCWLGPVVAGGAGRGRLGPVGAGAEAAGAFSACADRCRSVPVPLTDRKKRCILNTIKSHCKCMQMTPNWKK